MDCPPTMLEYQQQHIDVLERENLTLKAELAAERSAAAVEITNVQGEILALVKALQRSETNNAQTRSLLREERRRCLALSAEVTSWRACAQALRVQKEDLMRVARRAVKEWEEGSDLEEETAIQALRASLKSPAGQAGRTRVVS